MASDKTLALRTEEPPKRVVYSGREPLRVRPVEEGRKKSRRDKRAVRKALQAKR